MTNDEARREILSEFEKFSARDPKGAQMMNGMLFYQYLAREKPEMLRFRTSGDKWQTVHGWLLRAGKVRD